MRHFATSFHFRHGFTLFLILVGLVIASIAFFAARSKHLLDLAGRQRALLARLRTDDIPGRLRPVQACEAITVGSPRVHWFDIPYPEAEENTEGYKLQDKIKQKSQSKHDKSDISSFSVPINSQ